MFEVANLIDSCMSCIGFKTRCISSFIFLSGSIEANKSLEISNTYPQTHHNLANAYVSIGEITQATNHYYQAIKLDPKFFHSYPPLIKILKKEGMLKEAERLNQQLNQLVSN